MKKEKKEEGEKEEKKMIFTHFTVKLVLFLRHSYMILHGTLHSK